MKQIFYITLGFLIAFPVLYLQPTPAESYIPPIEKPVLTHQQLVWSYAIEWCESQGKTWAINKKDKDGTPSYGSFQFKPSTFFSYAKIYGVEVGTSTEAFMDPELQRKVFTEMVLHQEDINWRWQFPDCVRRNGLPPKNPVLR